jgi:hypothetical protein
MNYIPFDTRTTKVDTGFGKLQEGWYALVITSIESKASKNGNQVVNYKSDVIDGPAGGSESMAGKKCSDRITATQEWAGRHMELAAAAFGSVRGMQEACDPATGMLSFDTLIGRQYLALITLNDKGFNNVIRRLPLTQDRWQAVCSGSEPEEIPSGHEAAQVQAQPQQVQPAVQQQVITTAPQLVVPLVAAPPAMIAQPTMAAPPAMAAPVLTTVATAPVLPLAAPAQPAAFSAPPLPPGVIK